jgi:hypothetical protein
VNVAQDEGRTPLVVDGLAVVAVALAGLTGIVVFLPAQGFVATPLHDALSAVLGRLTFALPLLLLLGGIIRLAGGTLPVGRLVGLGLLLLGVLVAEHLLSSGDAGLAGRWLANVLLDAVGGVGTAAVLVCVLGIGAGLTFGVRFGQK